MNDDFFTSFRNFVAKTFLHLVGLAFLGFIVGTGISAITNEFESIGVNTNAYDIAYKWSYWLFESWSQLTWEAYAYIKIKLLGCIFGPLVVALISYMKFFDTIKEWKWIKPKEKVFGDATWASQADVKKAGLRSKSGMMLGLDDGGYFVADGFQHALLFAPTGAGKGVGFVIPNLLFWSDSVVVHDIKLENHGLTSGWRAKQGQEVFVWEPSNPDGVTHCYNPIDWVSSKPGQMVDDVQKISSLIMPKQDFWENESRSLFMGIVLYLIADSTKRKSFGEVVRTLRSDDVVYNLAVVLDTLGSVIHPVAYMNLAAFLQKADKERSGVISTLNSGLELWANPLIDAATASSDFNVLEFKKKKTTVYVGLTPDNISRLQKLMQVFYQQATEFLSRKMPNLKEEPYGVMFLLDEFPTLGKMEQFKSGIAYFRGYRVRLFLIIQDTQQLKGTYEEAGMNSFLSNSTFRITFAANNYETANLISQLCGNKTVKQTSHSAPRFFDLNPATRTMNTSEVQRALLLPQEVIQLPRDEQIVLIESMPPIKSKKIRYFDDKFFMARLLPPTFVPTQKPYDASKDPALEDEAAPATEEENDIDSVDTGAEFEAENTSDALGTEETQDEEELLDDSDTAVETEDTTYEEPTEDEADITEDAAYTETTASETDTATEETSSDEDTSASDSSEPEADTDESTEDEASESEDTASTDTTPTEEASPVKKPSQKPKAKPKKPKK